MFNIIEEHHFLSFHYTPVPDFAFQFSLENYYYSSKLLHFIFYLMKSKKNNTEFLIIQGYIFLP